MASPCIACGVGCNPEACDRRDAVSAGDTLDTRQLPAIIAHHHSPAAATAMIAIRPLTHFDPARLTAIASGYMTAERYRVSRAETDSLTSFRLALEALPAPEVFRFPFGDEDLERYAALVPNDFCLGAWDGQEQVAITLAGRHDWNQTLWVWEFHVSETYRGRGIGRQLMEALATRAAAANLRAIVCETQNTNVAAIRFYRSVGFTLDGVDISYYTNHDIEPGGTVAVFMKRRIE